MTDLLTTEAPTALFRVIMIDLVLAGDNAIGLVQRDYRGELRRAATINPLDNQKPLWKTP